LTPQHQFHPKRKWRFDFAHVKTLTAIEIQGYGQGHASYSSMYKDYEKNNEAIRHGWSIIYLMGIDLEDKTINRTIKYVNEIISLRPLAVQRTLESIPPITNYNETIRKLLED
jgi:hypothetical protein